MGIWNPIIKKPECDRDRLSIVPPFLESPPLLQSIPHDSKMCNSSALLMLPYLLLTETIPDKHLFTYDLICLNENKSSVYLQCLFGAGLGFMPLPLDSLQPSTS